MVKVEVVKGIVYGKGCGEVLEMPEKDAESLMALGVVKELGGNSKKTDTPPPAEKDAKGGGK